MNKKTSIKILGIIFGITLLAEILTWVLGAPPEKSIVRLLGLTGMFLWLLSGSRFARYALSVVYFLSALLAALSAARPGEAPAFIALFLSFSTFSFVAAVFFVRSTVLGALTDPVP
ncbi:hypothetical protein GJ698_09150 [Pseudoduganella sp. FT26W]|uniref:DUF2568 domain-containing protein n=1 Tax=Duganella aquatilis TaxID=2666082 RepID=A0A844CWI3_9BURK|nr:hypothetical protein [Duganella aquatilis]MRW84258.1 hypothetical protein [Duganella aquatilis]